MIKSIQKYFFILIYLLASQGHAQLEVDVASECALLMNSDTGKVLFEKNGSKKMFPASCTKIPFAAYAIKYHSHLYDKVLVGSQNCLKTLTEIQKSKNNFSEVPSYILETDASHMGCKLGEELKFYDLLVGTMVVSGDDASNMIAEAIGEGNIDKCVDNVNAYLRSIGCTNTNFTNPHGLHHPDHVTTAYDLALMSRDAMKEPHFAEIAKMPRFSRPKTNKQEAVALQQTNRLLLKSSPYYYAPAVGIKTGYHRRAGYCLVAQAENHGRKLIAVLLNANSKEARFTDAKNLFEAAFQETPAERLLLKPGPQTFETTIAGGDAPLKTHTEEALAYTYYPSEEPTMRCQLLWNELSLPINTGAPVGELTLLLDDSIHKKISLFAANDVKPTLLFSLQKWMVTPTGIVSGLILFVIVAILLFRRR